MHAGHLRMGWYGLLAAALFGVLWPELSYASGPGPVTQLIVWLQQAAPWQLALAMLVVPLFAVPLTALLMVVGAALPLPLALAVTMATCICHHVLVFAAARSRLSRRLQRHLQQKRMLPVPRAQRPVCDDVIFVLVATWAPGLSYILKLAFVALAGLTPLRFFALSIPSQLSAALPYLLLGDLAQHLSLTHTALLISMVAALLWLVGRAVRGRRAQGSSAK